MGTLNPAMSHPTALSESPSTPSLLLPAQLGLLSANPALQEHAARCTKRAFLPPGTQREWTFALENEATKALAQAEKCVASLQSHVNGACAQNTKGGEEAEPLGRERQPVWGAPRGPSSLTSPLCTPSAACTPARLQHLLTLRDCSRLSLNGHSSQQCGGHGPAPGTLKCRESLCNQGCATLQRSRAAPSLNRSVQRLLAPSHHVHSSCLHAQSSLCQVPDVQSHALGQREVTSSVCHLLVP